MVSISVGAPGVSVTSRASSTALPSISSFSTVYIVGQVEESVSISSIPYNTPTLFTSSQEFEAAIDGVPQTGPELVSYLSIKNFFRNALTARMYFIRVGRPATTIRTSFDLTSAFKDDGESIPSPIVAGDKVYVKLSFDGYSLGSVNSAGTWLGLPVTIPTTPNTAENKLAVTKVIVDAIVAAISVDDSLNDFVYVRDYDASSIDFTSRVYGQPISVTANFTAPDLNTPINVFTDDFYNIQTISTNTQASQSAREVIDYIQSVETSFTGSLPKGYLIAPAGFDQFNSKERQRLGRAMENYCARQSVNWITFVDCGPSSITHLNDYSDYVEQTAGKGFTPNEKYLVGNSIYQYKGSSPLVFNEADTQETVAQFARLQVGTPITISGQTSDLIEAKTSATFNELNLPGSLQSPSATYGISIKSVAVTSSSATTNALTTTTAHGFSLGEKVYTAGVADSGLGTNTTYYAIPLTETTIKLAANIQNAASGVSIPLTGTSTNGELYGDPLVNGVAAPSVPMTRGRKYVLSLTNVANTEKLILSPSVDSRYLVTASTTSEITLASPTGIFVGDVVYFTGAVDQALTAKTSAYYVKSISGSSITLSLTLGGNAIVLQGNAGSGSFLVKSLSSNFEDATSNSINSILSASTNTRYVVPLTGLAAQVYLNFVGKPMASLPVDIREVEEPNANVWNFNVITLQELTDEQVKLNRMVRLERGLDSHNALFEDSQIHSSSRGYLAWFGSYLEDLEGFLNPPSSTVAGIAIRRERAEGVAAPPAGTQYPAFGIIKPEIDITTAHQTVSNPYGANFLRVLPGSSETVVWGSRTRVNPANAAQRLYSFINQRVVTNVAISSLEQAFDDFVFNSISSRNILFTQIRTRIDAILYAMYSQGLLFGNTPQDAYKIVITDQNNSGGTLTDGIVFATVFIATAGTLESIRIDLINSEIDGVIRAAEVAGFE